MFKPLHFLFCFVKINEHRNRETGYLTSQGETAPNPVDTIDTRKLHQHPCIDREDALKYLTGVPTKRGRTSCQLP